MTITSIISDWKAFRQQLMPQPAHGRRYALVDTSRHSDLYERIMRHASHQCLYTDIEAIRLARYAPYCIDLESSPDFAHWWFANTGQGWQQHWGWMFQSRLDLQALQLHFKKITHIQLASGQQLLWRFYDPRVLKKTLPGLSHEQHGEMFSPLQPVVFYQSESSRFVHMRTEGSNWLGGHRAKLDFYPITPL